MMDLQGAKCVLVVLTADLADGRRVTWQCHHPAAVTVETVTPGAAQEDEAAMRSAAAARMLPPAPGDAFAAGWRARARFTPQHDLAPVPVDLFVPMAPVAAARVVLRIDGGLPYRLAITRTPGEEETGG